MLKPIDHKFEFTGYASYVTFIIVIILAIFFHTERTFADGAAEIIDVTNRNTIYPSTLHPLLSPKLFAQFPLLIADVLGAPFESYSLIYSLGYLVPNLIAFLIIRFVFREKLLSLLCPLILIFDIGSNFFFIASLAPVFPYLLLLYCILKNFDSTLVPKSINWVLLTYLTVTSSINHPTGFVLTSIVIGTFLLKKGGIKKIEIYVAELISLISVAIYFVFLTNDYAKNAIQEVSLGFESPLTICYFLLGSYTFSSVLIIVISSLNLFKRKNILLTSYFLIAALSFVLYVNMGVKLESRSSIYSIYAYSGFVFIALLFAYEYIIQSPQLTLRHPLVMVTAGGILFVILTGNVIAGSSFFKFRMDYIERAVFQCNLQGAKKCFINYRNIPPYANKMAPHHRAESLFASSRLEHEMLTTVTPFEHRIIPDKWLNSIDPDFNGQSSYFSLNSLSSSSPDIVTPDQIEIDILRRGPIKAHTNEVIQVPVRVRNLLNTQLSSISYSGHPIKLSYHIYKDKEVVVWDGLRSPLEFDVQYSLDQFLTLKAPATKGLFIVHVDIVLEGAKWIRINESFTLKVH